MFCFYVLFLHVPKQLSIDGTDLFYQEGASVHKRLNAQLHLIQKNITQNPKIEFSYFQPDSKKDGGTYTTVSGRVKKIDEYHRRII